MARILSLFPLALTISACIVLKTSPEVDASLRPDLTPSPASTFSPTEVVIPSVTATPRVPEFTNIIIIVLENREFGLVIDNPRMPNFNRWAQEYTLLTQHYAITHPSLPNFLALVAGDTFGIDYSCNDCFIDAQSLPDLIEASGLTWKTYQEDMPSPCYLGDTHIYVQKHNPFVYFDPIRLDEERCRRSVVPFDELAVDLEEGSLPNFVFITPNLCHSAHDCSLDVADAWLGEWVGRLMDLLTPNADHTPFLLILTWDEGQGTHSCCGLPEEAGGRVATVLISPLVRNGFQDSTAYTHYSLLKTIAEAWGLPYLGRATGENNAIIIAPWK